MLKRTVSLLLVLVLAMALFTGCQGSSTPSETTAESAASQIADSAPADEAEEAEEAEAAEPTDDANSEPAEEVEEVVAEPAGDVYPLADDGSIVFDMILSLTNDAPSNMNDYLDGTNVAWPAILEATGVQLNMRCIKDAVYMDQANLILASQDVPDIMALLEYTGGADQAYEDGLFVDLVDYEDCMPNYMKFVNASAVNQHMAYSEEGHMMSMNQTRDKLEPPSAGVSIRRDWLDELNLEMPTTIPEWHDVLTAFKDHNGGSPVMDWSNDGFFLCNTFNGVYGIVGGLNGNFVSRDGTVVFTPSDEGYREYVELISSWFNEGLIDKEFANNDLSAQFAADFGLMATNTIGAQHMQVMMAGDFFAQNGILPEDAYFELAPFPTMEDGSPAPVQPAGKSEPTLYPNGWYFSADGVDIENAVRFIDYLYTEEGAMITNYGIEGETYNMVDGKPVQTELFTNNPDGLSTLSAQEVYLMHTYSVIKVDRLLASLSDEGIRCAELWAGQGDYNLPVLTFTADENIEIASIQADLDTLVAETTIKWMTGAEELNDSTWENFQNQLKAMRSENLTAIYQDAYDRWAA